MRVICPNPDCKAALKVRDQTSAKAVRCPKCKTAIPLKMDEEELEALDVPEEPASAPLQQSAATPQTAGKTAKAGAPEGNLQAKVGDSEWSVIETSSQKPPDDDVNNKAPLPYGRGSVAPAERPAPLHIQAWIERISAGRPRVRTAVRLALTVSFAVHLALTPMIPEGHKIAQADQERFQTEYAKRIESAKSARVLARTVERKMLEAPPPPDPESVAENALRQSLTSDIQRVTEGLIDVNLQQDLQARLETSLADELKAAAKDIAEGKLSEEELKSLHMKFKEKAHHETMAWREEYKEKNQVDLSRMTVTDWYEKKVATPLRRTVQGELFGDTENRYRYIWYEAMNGAYTGVAPGFLDSDKYLSAPNRNRELEILASGGYYGPRYGMCEGSEKRPHNQFALPDWPKPSAAQAVFMGRILANQYGGQRQEYAASGKEIVLNAYPAFRQAMEHYYEGFYPHLDESNRESRLASIEEVGQKTMQAFQAYAEQSEGGENGASLQQAQKDALQGLKALLDATQAVFVHQNPRYGAINESLRLEYVMGDERDALRKRLVKSLVDTLKGPIENLAESQFREGMLISEKGVEAAKKEFSSEILALLERDMNTAVGKDLFNIKLLLCRNHPYRSKLSREPRLPTPEEAGKVRSAHDQALSEWGQEGAQFAKARAARIKTEFEDAANGSVKALLGKLVDQEGRLQRQFYAQADTVDFSDDLEERLESRQLALQGRGQDLANLTKDGVPDTSAPLIALMMGGAKGKGASLEPVLAGMQPDFILAGRPMHALRYGMPVFPPQGKKADMIEQAKVEPKFKTPAFESIPFLANFPRLDGDLSDWGSIRPLVLRPEPATVGNKKREPLLLYAAWNYQGFFFGYQVEQKPHEFTPPTEEDMRSRSHTARKWVTKGDYLMVSFDTLDAKLEFRGDPHMQEFYVVPKGTDTDTAFPGSERWFASRRDGRHREHGWYNKFSLNNFPRQPEAGPDGNGPYRVARFTEKGYCVEVFLPRSLFKVPVFAPGWFMGFEANVAYGLQPQPHGYFGWYWNHRPNNAMQVTSMPERWGDLLMLGTDARFFIQDADGQISQSLTPGHSYLITVIDPDRNVNLMAEDTVLVSAEVAGGRQDTEVYILKETGPNTSTFRGFVNTQPGLGRDMPGNLEMMPGYEVRFGYVDFANGKGDRNVVYEAKLPVINSLMQVGQKR